MKKFPLSLLAAPLASVYVSAFAQTQLAIHEEKPTESLGVVTINTSSGQPTSLPTQIPTSMEGISKEQIEQSINATDSEDALRYMPSLLVRKRYIADYNHAVLSSRASGIGNSARSAVYVDGILLSNYLGNGATYAPRWGLVTPQDIAQVDAMYGPFSTAYPGNSVGAVVDYVTRMPQQLEAHVKAGYVSQPFDLYATHRPTRPGRPARPCVVLAASNTIPARCSILTLVSRERTGLVNSKCSSVVKLRSVATRSLLLLSGAQ